MTTVSITIVDITTLVFKICVTIARDISQW